LADGGRVIAGRARGIRLESAPEGTRPLTNRVKEALFAALEAGGALDGPFLDLFAGSGAAGIEALSRGAPSATFVEREGKACAVIGANLRRARLEGGQVVRADVIAFLATPPAVDRHPYRACLADPPYRAALMDRVLESLGDPARGWLAADAVVVARHFWRDQPPPAVGTLQLERQRRFGETMLSFYTGR